ncbi:MAG: DUF501 domain-containing protein [Actinobacteria bacterium]|nr:DUF501 domain-containing protein [Actinomycetota bacterium]
MKRATEFSKDAGKAKSKFLKVLESIISHSLNPAETEDEEFFKKVTGRYPHPDSVVLKRCRFGKPVAFASMPVSYGEPFPTMFWLTCPYLLKLCGKLESALLHRTLEAEIERTERLRKEFYEAQMKMINIRKEVARATFLDLPRSVLETGIGGVRNLMRVKCLHAHMAASFAGIESPVTKALYESITVFECEEGCF